MAPEFLSESMARVIESAGALPVKRTAAFGIEIAEELAAAHALGIVHRDVKPQSVLIGLEGKAKLTYFGYDMLALAVERASGQTFSRFLQQRVFGPLDMTNTVLIP